MMYVREHKLKESIEKMSDSQMEEIFEAVQFLIKTMGDSPEYRIAHELLIEEAQKRNRQ